MKELNKQGEEFSANRVADVVLKLRRPAAAAVPHLAGRSEGFPLYLYSLLAVARDRGARVSFSLWAQ